MLFVERPECCGATFQNIVFFLDPNSPLCLLSAPCQPCSDAEILLAVCTSDIGESPSHSEVGSMYSPPASNRGRSAPFLQWREAASRRWSRRRTTRPSACFSAVSTDRRPRSSPAAGRGHAAGPAASRCPPSAGRGPARGSSSSRGRCASARPGWAALPATRTSCGFTAKRSCGGPTPARWTRTERWTSSPGRGDSLNRVVLSLAG